MVGVPVFVSAPELMVQLNLCLTATLKKTTDWFSRGIIT